MPNVDPSSQSFSRRWPAVVAVLVLAVAAPGLGGCHGPVDGSGSGEVRHDDNYDPVPVASHCRDDQQLCDRECVDLDDHTLHCGECGNRCPDGSLCRDGRCIPQEQACPSTPCTGFSYCDDGICRPGCQTDVDCTGGQVCNQQSRSCECPGDQRLCGGRCFERDDPEACGEHCLRCPSGGGTGQPECVDGVCRLECGPEARSCDRRCVECPVDAVETTCEGGGCVATECEGDLKACGGTCVPCPAEAAETGCEDERCVATDCPGPDQGICDGRCVDCPAGTVEPDCQNGVCRAAECQEGMRACDGRCVECPAGATETTCVDGQCRATACRDNQRPCDGECRLCPPDVERTTCIQGVCVEQCVGYFKRLCPGETTCTDTAVDPDNCGACGHSCGSDESCDGGHCVPNYVYTASDDEAIHKIDPDGQTVWTHTEHLAPVRTVAVDPYDRLYTGSEDQLLSALTADGYRLWTFEHQQTVVDIAVADAGYVFVAGGASTGWRLGPTGDEIFEFDIGPPGFEAVAADPEGYWYAGNDNTLWRFDPDDEIDWSIDVLSLRDVAVADDQKVFAITDGTLSKYDAADGDELWERDDVDDTPRALAVDGAGDVVVISDDDRLRKLDGDSGSEIWSHAETGDVDQLHAVAVDNNGYVYLAVDDRLRRLDEGGDVSWTYEEHEGAVLDVAADPGPVGAFPSAWVD